MLFKDLDIKKLPSGTEEYDALKRNLSTFQVSMSWETLKPIIDTAELTYLLPTIGQELYDELNTDYAAYPGAALAPGPKALIRKLQKAMAYFTWLTALPELITSMGDMGVKESTDTNSTALIPRQWTYKQALINSFKTGNLFLEQALAYLEANADIFTTWTESAAYTKSKELFFNSAQELEDFLPCKTGRIVYCQLRPFIRKAEKKYILPVIGKELFDELKTAIVDRTLTEVQKDLINEIREALSEWSLQYAIPFLRIEIVDGLLEPALDTDGMFQRDKPSEDTVRSLWVNLQDGGRFFLTRLKTYLTQNIDDFPTYANSSAYEQKTPFTGFITDTDGDNDNAVIGFG